MGLAAAPSSTGSLSRLSGNNLGGLGPKRSSDRGIVFEDVLRVDSVSVAMTVTNTTPYYTSDASKNGLKNGIAYLNVMTGKPLGLKFSFYSAVTGAPAKVDEFRFSILDVDMGPTARETVTASGFEEFYVTGASTVVATRDPAGRVKFSASALSGKANNPVSTALLTEEQLNNCVGLRIVDATSFSILLSTEVAEKAHKSLVPPSLMQVEDEFAAGQGLSSRNLIFSTSSDIFELGAPHLPDAVEEMSEPVVMPPTVSLNVAKAQERVLDKSADAEYYDGSGVKDAPSGQSPAASQGALPPAPQTSDVPSSPSASAAAAEARECASEWNDGWADCPECTMSRECSCPGGHVRFGYEPYWTAWTNVASTVDCSVESFGDPYPGHGKLCLCTLEAVSPLGLGCAAKSGSLWWPPILVATVCLGVHVSWCIAHARNNDAGGVVGPVEKSLDATLPLVKVAPMMCVLFVAIASRVGETARLPDSGAPPEPAVAGLALGRNAGASNVGVGAGSLPHWGSVDFQGLRGTKAGIGVCAIALLAQVTLRYHSERDSIRLEQDAAPGNRPPPLCSVLYRVLVLCMYLLLLILTLRLLLLRTSSGAVPRLEASVNCTAIVALWYFGVYFVMLMMDFGTGARFPLTAAVAKLTALNLNFAPMICVLFLALQAAVDSADSMVSSHLVFLMSTCTFLVLLQAGLAALTPLALGAEVRPKAVGADAGEDIVLKKGHCVFLMMAARWTLMAYLLVCMLRFGRNLVRLQTCPQGLGRFISILTLVYFLVYVLLWLTMTCGRRSPGERTKQGLWTLGMAKNAVDVVCPLLAALRVSWWISGA